MGHRVVVQKKKLKVMKNEYVYNIIFVDFIILN